MRSKQRVTRALIALGVFLVVQAGGRAAEFAVGPHHSAATGAVQAGPSPDDIDWP
ncbi:hypothetical protein HZZ00_06020 [Streptomyces sp. NEAU-sy36]|uniref:hypothetical protein n=1 Tax=unclassified Streptomyces TaxID=2593676 RepID=UPI0015D5D40D|nr:MULTISPECIES: hypothetical protein [unclassified Streptomyces]QLJ00585.1 hypothetical protein HZZ00_06020 [Streptomyces sp. NEAU-sy36]